MVYRKVWVFRSFFQGETLEKEFVDNWVLVVVLKIMMGVRL